MVLGIILTGKRTILTDNDLQLRNDLAIIQQKVYSDAKVAYIYILIFSHQELGRIIKSLANKSTSLKISSSKFLNPVRKKMN